MSQVVSGTQKRIGMARLFLLSQILRRLVKHGVEGAEVVVLLYVEFE
jgi:hypothetical protein